MADAKRLSIIFQLSGVAFLMSVADLLAIRGAEEDELTPYEDSGEPFQLGTLTYRGTEVLVYELAWLFGLTEEQKTKSGPLLIFSGSDGPWAISVDHVVGLFDSALFELQSLPAYLFDDEFVPYHQVSQYDGDLLIYIDSQQVDLAWRGGLQCA